MSPNPDRHSVEDLVTTAMAASMAVAAVHGGGFSHSQQWWQHHHGEQWVVSWMSASVLVFVVFVVIGAVAYQLGGAAKRRRPLGRGEEGSVAVVEFVLLVPALLGVIALAVVAGRISKADGEVQGAVRAAARAASMQRSPGAAQAAADQAARAELQSAGVVCRDYTLQMTPGPPGGVDRATLSCVVSLVDVDWMGVATSKTVVSSFNSPVDLYRTGR